MHLGSLESLIELEGREIQRLMLEEHIGLRGPGNVGESVEGSDNVLRSHKRIRSIGLKTIFGEIQIERTQYGKPGHTSLTPKEALLNLPQCSYSHGVQRRIALEVAKGSHDEAIASIEAQTGVRIPKRQAEEIAQSKARDFDAFYERRGVLALREITKENDLLILSTDGKGVAMRKDDLRELTKNVLKTRRS